MTDRWCALSSFLTGSPSVEGAPPAGMQDEEAPMAAIKRRRPFQLRRNESVPMIAEPFAISADASAPTFEERQTDRKVAVVKFQVPSYFPPE